jgi:microcystin-dependent protein
MIISWNGKLNEIPKDWALCDGSNGTPDLRDKFIIGGGKTYKIGEKGGKSFITLEKSNLPPIGQAYVNFNTFGGPYHHNSNGFIKYTQYYSVSTKNGNGDDWGSVYMIDLNEGLNSSPINLMNPYYSLFFIVKLKYFNIIFKFKYFFNIF